MRTIEDLKDVSTVFAIDAQPALGYIKDNPDLFFTNARMQRDNVHAFRVADLICMAIEVVNER